MEYGTISKMGDVGKEPGSEISISLERLGLVIAKTNDLVSGLENHLRLVLRETPGREISKNEPRMSHSVPLVNQLEVYCERLDGVNACLSELLDRLAL